MSSLTDQEGSRVFPSIQRNFPMQMKPSLQHVLLALVVAVSAGACARTTPGDEERTSTVSDGVKAGRTVGGYTYTDAPVDVKLGPNTFRIPANYLDSQIAPWPGEGVTLAIEWPDMLPSEPGARADPRTNDFRKEIMISVTYVDRLPIETSLERQSSNHRLTEEGSLQRQDPRERLDLRVAQDVTMGLTPYAIDEGKMAAYSTAYSAKFGFTPARSIRSDADWYVARGDEGRITTFIKCDSKRLRPEDGLRFEGGQIIDDLEHDVAACTHYITDVGNKLLMSLYYNRIFLKEWKRMEVAVRSVIERSKAARET